MSQNDTNINKSAEENDAYAYLHRDGEFSSENFKIEIKQLPKFYGIRELKKLFDEKLKLKTNKIKSPGRNSPYAFVCFRNEDDRDNAIKVLSGYKWKGKQLQAIKAKPSADPLVQKRKKQSEEDDDNNSKKSKIDENLTQEERLKLSTTPLWNVDYNEQLKIKQNNIKEILTSFGKDLWYRNPELRTWLKKQQENYDGLPCELLDIRHAKEIDGYRNKCEFSVGLNHDSDPPNLPTVGFRVGAYVNGTTSIGSVDNLRHIPEAMKVVVKVFEDYVRQSTLKVFDHELHTGNFRQLCVRSAPDNQLMLIVGIHPQNMTDTEKSDFKQSLIDFFSEGNGKIAKVTSLYYQEIIKMHSGVIPPAPEHLWGGTHIFDKVLGLTFRISPQAFFQINTAGTDVLYSSVIELAEPTTKSTVIDVCCGTGTIGLCFAEKCGQVLGLELNAQAIVDAKENAVANGIENSEFFAGRAEDILGAVCFKATNDDVIAIVDPPRAGLHQKAIQLLRKIPKINRLVYLSCNPKLAIKNFIDLGRPESKTLHGEPFVLVKAVPVDMFPHTNHCELVACFQRWDKVLKIDGASAEPAESIEENLSATKVDLQES